MLEARALDVIPGTIKKYEKMGDRAMVNTLTIIANDEVGHVSSGSRWYRHQCELEQLNPDETFFALVRQYMKGPLKGPFNRMPVCVPVSANTKWTSSRPKIPGAKAELPTRAPSCRVISSF